MIRNVTKFEPDGNVAHSSHHEMQPNIIPRSYSENCQATRWTHGDCRRGCMLRCTSPSYLQITSCLYLYSRSRISLGGYKSLWLRSCKNQTALRATSWTIQSKKIQGTEEDRLERQLFRWRPGRRHHQDWSQEFFQQEVRNSYAKDQFNRRKKFELRG